ncbi:MAG: hypothetical protein DCF15_10450 [Phormidesmis priestleyi]|uniref:Uncharacterized protein n=1 Tax=Phormidesmis priestleyi TaxID=268141 RepID=A0A2W4Z9Q9_9CYAN|nr:MAG: hypothetical protein DCF15_10450 [Phormidesmis priestleyi]
MNIEKQNQLAMNAFGILAGKYLSEMVSGQRFEFENLTGEVTMSDQERADAINDGFEEAIAGTTKMFEGALGERLIPKGSRRRRSHSKQITVKPKRFNITQID